MVTIQDYLNEDLLSHGCKLELTLFDGVHVRRGSRAPHYTPTFKRGSTTDKEGIHVIGYVIGHNEDMIILSPTIYPNCSEEQEFPLAFYNIEYEAIHSWRLATTSNRQQ